LRIVIAIFLLCCCSAGQNEATKPAAASEEQAGALNVNWLYGAYVPKDVKLRALTNHQRTQLYLRQTYITWGIYLKTALFSFGDQAGNSPREWGGGIGGYGKRVASRYGQFAIQNTISSAGNSLLGYEPRYERCRCSGAGPRTRHAILRNFVTYDRTEHGRRPQIAMYAGAMIAGMVASTWKPSGSSVWIQGYQSILTQAGFGSVSNLLGEFAPEIGKLLKRKGK
jgi:hypothetical protein